jgi:hypothetical protein
MVTPSSVVAAQDGFHGVGHEHELGPAQEVHVFCPLNFCGSLFVNLRFH